MGHSEPSLDPVVLTLRQGRGKGQARAPGPTTSFSLLTSMNSLPLLTLFERCHAASGSEYNDKLATPGLCSQALVLCDVGHAGPDARRVVPSFVLDLVLVLRERRCGHALLELATLGRSPSALAVGRRAGDLGETTSQPTGGERGGRGIASPFEHPSRRP